MLRGSVFLNSVLHLLPEISDKLAEVIRLIGRSKLTLQVEPKLAKVTAVEDRCLPFSDIGVQRRIWILYLYLILLIFLATGGRISALYIGRGIRGRPSVLPTCATEGTSCILIYSSVNYDYL